ncbi:MAG: hypothetical protein K2P94_05600 [Rhodospirillaceae bacterium]|nr:hypothetical protein [Rhodospirillaceae bacterium]
MSAATKGLTVIAAVALAGVAVFSFRQTQNLSGERRMHEAALETDGGDAMDSTPINACALLTDDEVSAAVGAKVTPGERRDDGEVGGKGDYAPPGTYSSTCFWQFHADASGIDDPNLPMGGRRFAILNAMVWPAGGGDAVKFLQSFRDAFKDEIIPSDPVPVDIGDEGLWWGDGVAARKGDRSFGISVFLQNGDKATQRKMEESLARKIADRL